MLEIRQPEGHRLILANKQHRGSVNPNLHFCCVDDRCVLIYLSECSYPAQATAAQVHWSTAKICFLLVQVDDPLRTPAS